MASEYIAGSQVRLDCLFSVGLSPSNQTATFADGSTQTYVGTLTDPTTVSLLVMDGTGVQTTYTPTKESTGLYHEDITTSMKTLAMAETWTYSWRGTGTVVAISEGSFVLKRSNQG